MSRLGKVEAISQMSGLWLELIPIVSGLLKILAHFWGLFFTSRILFILSTDFNSVLVQVYRSLFHKG